MFNVKEVIKYFFFFFFKAQPAHSNILIFIQILSSDTDIFSTLRG